MLKTNYSDYKSFTLAETLITLTIIGVVAAISIPSLMQNFKDQEFKTTYRKAFSVASQAWKDCLYNEELVPRTTWTDSENNNKNFLAFKSKFKLTLDCTSTSSTKCWVDGEKYWNKPSNGDSYAFIDSSGVAWSNEGKASGGAYILVDVNGPKAPNKYGKDRFVLAPIKNDTRLMYESGTLTFDSVGLPEKIAPFPDVVEVEANRCPSGGCYYTSLLID